MIDPKELRMGNWVLCEKGHAQIDAFAHDRFAIKGDGWVAAWYKPDEIHPIPLTEEWLLRFGFETIITTRNSGYTRGYDEGGVYRVSRWICLAEENPFYVQIAGMQEDGWHHNHDIEIKYVHQLQNFHFALTNQELTIKTPEHATQETK